jgi:hypothetical protein
MKITSKPRQRKPVPARVYLCIGALVLSHRFDRSKKTVLFSLDAGREEKMVRWTGGLTIAEGERPQSFDHDRLPGVPQGPFELSLLAEGVDLAVAEITDQQVTTEFAKAL